MRGGLVLHMLPLLQWTREGAVVDAHSFLYGLEIVRLFRNELGVSISSGGL